MASRLYALQSHWRLIDSDDHSHRPVRSDSLTSIRTQGLWKCSQTFRRSQRFAQFSRVAGSGVSLPAPLPERMAILSRLRGVSLYVINEAAFDYVKERK